MLSVIILVNANDVPKCRLNTPLVETIFAKKQKRI